MEAWDPVNSLDHAVATAFELAAHLLHRALIAAQGFDTGNLRETGGAGVDVGHEPRKILSQVRPHHAVAQSPAGHGVRLGEAIEQNGAVFHSLDRYQRYVLAFEDQTAVDLIG